MDLFKCSPFYYEMIMLHVYLNINRHLFSKLGVFIKNEKDEILEKFRIRRILIAKVNYQKKHLR